MCLPCRAVFLAGAYRWNPLSVLPGKLPSRSAQEAPCTLRADPDNPGGTSRGDGFDVDTRKMGDLTMALLPAVGSRVGILWSGQRILAKVLNAGDPPGIFFVEFFIGRRRAIRGCHVDDSPWWWQPPTGDEQDHYLHRRVRHPGHGRHARPRLPLFDGLPPKPRPPGPRRTAEQIARSRARAVATRARNKIAARRAAAAAEIAATAKRQAEREAWKASHPAPTRTELDTLRGMFPGLTGGKDRR